MNEPIMLTVFTDPMMGLSYESQPMLDQLKEKYGSRLVIDYRMSVLVRDVSDFMTPEERALPPEIGIPRYNLRLAGIYKSEEFIGHLPINMEGFHLFDPQHRSSRPLCLAYHAAKLTAPEKAEQFLINLRAATVLQNRPTTHRDVILEIVNETGIDEAAFIDHYLNGSADAALEEDQIFAQHLGIRALPDYLLSYGGHGWILPFLENADEFTLMIDRFVNESTYHD